jgi:N-methylhydantoinase A
MQPTGAAFVGVDIGGTFTDVALVGPDGRLHIAKVPTTPEDPRVAVVEGVRHVLASAGVAPDAVARVVHGTTLATNVVLERRGGPVALVATEGFADVLRLGRQARVEDDRYDLHYTPTPPPVDPALTFEVAERVSASGAVLVELTDAAVREVVRRVVDARPASVAICLLHAYAYPTHERRVADACRAALSDAFVVASSDVWPELREYERAMTTVVCALVGPVMARYLDGLERRLAEVGVRCPIEVMESSGGVLSAAAAARQPVRTVESGAAAGVLTAALVGSRLGLPDVISFDMGGTTAKTGIVRDGRPTVEHGFQLGGKGSFGGARPGTGIPVQTPVIDLAEVGAGGGSVAWLDAGGALRVGPRSAGAVPGPACYGRGGVEPTVTDANLLLGYLGADGGAGGLTLLATRAAAAVGAVADRLNLDAPAAATAIHEIANATMAAAIRMVTVQRGVDPRGFTLVAFGGAGPTHVARLAAMFGIRAVVVPWGAGVASAIGLVASTPTVEVVQTHVVDLARAEPSELDALYADLEARARQELGVDDDRPVVVTRSADLRYRGQAHELTVALGAQDGIDLDEVASRFGAEYRRAYGIDAAAPAQFVAGRLRAEAPVAQPPWPEPVAVPPTPATPVGARPVMFPDAGRFEEIPVFDWAALEPGARVDGPGLVVGPDATLVVPPGADAEVDHARNVRLVPAEPAGTGPSRTARRHHP